MSSKNQISQWTEFLSCPICCNVFSESTHRPISLSCGHTICKTCLIKLQQKKCPFDQNSIDLEPEDLPINFALLQLVGVVVKETEDEAGDQEDVGHLDSEGINLRQNIKFYKSSRQCIEQLSEYLNPGANGKYRKVIQENTTIRLLHIRLFWISDYINPDPRVQKLTELES